jgi:hypothetical protein
MDIYEKWHKIWNNEELEYALSQFSSDDKTRLLSLTKSELISKINGFWFANNRELFVLYNNLSIRLYNAATTGERQ